MAEPDVTVRRVLGDNIKRIRQVRDMTVRDLAARLKPLGLSLAPSGVSEVENATRKVAADELLVFAIALNTSIIDLLMPPDGESLTVADNIEMGTDDLYWWLRGDQPWPTDAPLDEFAKAAHGHHKRMLWLNNDPVVRDVVVLQGAVSLAQSGQSWRVFAGTLAPGLKNSLDQVNRSVGELIERIEDEDDAAR